MDVKLLIFVTLLCRLNTPTLTTGLADSNTDDVCTVSKLKTCKLSGDQLHRVPGPIGDKGATGAPGNPGLDGPKGETIQGLQGLPGQKGDKGLPGLNGSDGIKGDTGKPGLKGEPGDSNLGPKGPPGTQGEAGPPGPTGPNGAPGLSGLPALCHCTIEQKPEEEVSEGMSIPSSKPKKSDHISDVKMTSEKCVTGLGKSKSIKYTGKAPSTTDEIATKEYKYKSEQFWLSEEGVSLNDLYNLTQVQLKQYRHIATNAKQTISILKVDAKGAIYLTTKNGTFPITLTSLKSRDDATSQHTPNILSATAKNLSHDASQREHDYWDDPEMLLSNYINATYDELDAYTFKQNSKRSINDAVSKNITLVLENLLKNYENSQLPTHGKGYPTVVQTNILIRSMGPVSELDMDYSMDCYFRQYWRDTRLSFLGPIRSLSLSIKMLERIWRPDTYFYNGKHSYVHTITVPNKLLRISQHGDILYSMRLTIKAKCPMELRNFPMDRQSCPLILGSYAYSNQQLVYQWQNSQSVNFVPGMTLSQFDLISFPYRNFTFTRREGEFSVLQVSFNLQRHTGYFLIQVYVPCILIVVLSWVSFWIHREATSDRVGLGITTVLTLSTISLDSRTDLPKVRYATALDWFLLMSFFYCIATLLEFAGVHYFTKVGSGEIVIDDSEWEELIEEVGGDAFAARQLAVRRRSSARSATNFSFTLPAHGNPEDSDRTPEQSAVRLTMERTTQTDRRVPRWRQLLYCLAGDDRYRRQRQVEAGSRGHINSVSHIDRAARVMFPASFALLNLFYWMIYAFSNDDFAWSDNPMNTLSH